MTDIDLTQESVQENNIDQLVADYLTKYDNVFATQIDDEFFLYRLIGRSEYQTIYEDETFSDLEKENLIVETCLLYPENYDLDNCSAGIPSQLSSEILQSSLISDKEEIMASLENERTRILLDENEQINCLISVAFPNFTLEEIESWTMPKTLKYYTRAEWILANIKRVEIENYNNFLYEFEQKRLAEEKQQRQEQKEQEKNNAEEKETTIRGGSKKEKLTPEKLREREEFLKKFPEFANDNVLSDGIDGLKQDSVDTMSPALRPGY